VFAALGDRCELVGTLPGAQMDKFYESISVLAVPSRTTPTWSEQFGRVIVEAQARATPVVAYDSGEIPWVASESAALIVPEGDVVTLGNELAAAAIDPNRARELGKRGRDLVRERFTHDAVARQIAAAINEAVARLR
jgi:glycosyltransferase involved in cell wall biosynthesis